MELLLSMGNNVTSLAPLVSKVISTQNFQIFIKLKILNINCLCADTFRRVNQVVLTLLYLCLILHFLVVFRISYCMIIRSLFLFVLINSV